MICNRCGCEFEKAEPPEIVKFEDYTFETISVDEEVFGVVDGDKLILRCPNCKTKMVIDNDLTS